MSATTPEDRDVLSALLRASTGTPDRFAGATVIPLLEADEVEVEEHSLRSSAAPAAGRAVGQQYVFGGQSITIPAGARVDVDIAFEVVGEPGASIRFVTDLGTLRQDERFYVRASDSVAVGQRVVVGYTFVPDRLWMGVDARMWVSKIAGASRLRFGTAKVTITRPGIHQHPVTGRRSAERIFEVR